MLQSPVMAWFKKARKPIASVTAEKPSRVPEGLWVKCPDCGNPVYKKDLQGNLNVCPKCAHHFRLNAAERLAALFDGGEYVEYFRDLRSTDPLQFTDTKPYRERLQKTIESTGMNDSVVVASGRLDGLDVVIAAMEYTFIGGSMGVVAGEKLTRAVEMALERRQPAIIISCSGGARMMEGALSLMQMAKVSAALARLDRARLPYISILTDPTTGGVTASFAMLGDLNIAEPKALIGFAGPRVIEQTIRQKLPEGFQRSEFLVEHGMLDLVVDRRDMKAVVARALRFMGAELAPPAVPEQTGVAVAAPRADHSLLDRLSSLETFGIKLGLENISRLCEALGYPERSFTTLHVAGTNGKGSVTAMVHAALGAAGLRTARYTSPHLADITERFVIGDAPVDPATFTAVAHDVLDLADRLVASKVLRVLPTFFEATTAIAFELFRRAGTEIAVIEVGLGGRFDATNVITPMAGAITTIGFDHQQHLGGTLGEIAFEKAGIIKTGMTVVAGSLPPSAIDVVRRVAAERGATLVEAMSDSHVEADAVDGAARLTIATPTGRYGPLTLALRGDHQVGNAVVAVRLLEAAAAGGVPVTAAHVAAGLTSARWPARLEYVARGARAPCPARLGAQRGGRGRAGRAPAPLAPGAGRRSSSASCATRTCTRSWRRSCR